MFLGAPSPSFLGIFFCHSMAHLVIYTARWTDSSMTSWSKSDYFFVRTPWLWLASPIILLAFFFAGLRSALANEMLDGRDLERRVHPVPKDGLRLSRTPGRPNCTTATSQAGVRPVSRWSCAWPSARWADPSMTSSSKSDYFFCPSFWWAYWNWRFFGKLFRWVRLFRFLGDFFQEVSSFLRI